MLIAPWALGFRGLWGLCCWDSRVCPQVLWEIEKKRSGVTPLFELREVWIIPNAHRKRWRFQLLFSVISACCFLQQEMPAKCWRGQVTDVAAKQDQGFREPAWKTQFFFFSHIVSCFYFGGPGSLVTGCYCCDLRSAGVSPVSWEKISNEDGSPGATMWNRDCCSTAE